MNNVILIGDSIRMGYQPFVAQRLAGQAEVWGPEENSSHSTNVLVHLHVWVLHRRIDAETTVHVNAGLHDLKTIVYGERESVVPVEHYRRNVRQILETTRRLTPAKVIWALTTPVHDARSHAAHSRGRDFDRHNADVQLYNQAASEVCRELGVPVNDLYSKVMAAGLEQVQSNDGVHYTPEGYQMLADAVVAALRAS